LLFVLQLKFSFIIHNTYYNMMPKRRSKNVSDAEKDILLQLIQPWLNVIENIKVCITI